MTKVIRPNNQTSCEQLLGLPSVADARIREIEEKYDLLQYKVDGWCVWPLLRSSANRRLLVPGLGNRERLRRSELVALALKDVAKLALVNKASCFVKTYSSARAEQENGLYKDIFFDDLIVELGDCFKLEAVNNKAFLSGSRRAFIKNDLTTALFEFAARLWQRIPPPTHILNLASKLGGFLRQELGLDIFTSPRVANRLLSFYYRKRLYAWLLSRVGPECVFTADAGEYEITAAAKEQGIRVVEFQHGVIHRHHPSYSWPAYARPYKANMPIPDDIFVYGEYWKKELKTNGFWDKEPRVVGSVRLDRYRNSKAVHSSTSETQATRVVITTQGVDVERLIVFVSDFLKIAKGRLNLHLYIKLHPVYETDTAAYEAVFRNEERVHVFLGSEGPSTFDLISRADVHLSIYSTCHYDALGLGVPTVILPLEHHETVLNLYEAGHAFLAQTPQDLSDIVFEASKHRVPDNVREWYFEPGALENITRELEASSS